MFRFRPPAKDFKELSERNSETLRKIFLWIAIIALIFIVWAQVHS